MKNITLDRKYIAAPRSEEAFFHSKYTAHSSSSLGGGLATKE
jgi:hypothetical protein